MQKKLAIAGLALALTACAAGYQPIVDLKGVDQFAFEADLVECRAYAEQISPAESGLAGAAVGAGAGAVVGGIIGAFFGDAGGGAALGASLGGVEVGVAAAAGSVERQFNVIDNCLRGRGYKVLG